MFPQLFYGWRVLAAGCLLRVLGGGIHLYGFTVFFLPLSQDLGLNRAATSLVFSLARAEGAIEAPFVGYLIDRMGPRPIMVTSAILAGAGYMILSSVGRYSTFMVVYLGIISIAYGPGFLQCPILLANNWFHRQRSIAMALVSGSLGLGGALLSPLLALVVHAWGWRPAAVAAGLAILVIGVPLSISVRRSPESMGLMPDGAPVTDDPRDRVGQPSVKTEQADSSLSQALRTLAFWFLSLATLLRMASLSSLLVHFVPIMVWKGMAQGRAAFLLGMMALLGFPVQILLGWVADRVNKLRLMAACTILPTFGFLFLIHIADLNLLWLSLPLFTLLEAVFPMTWSTVADIYGRRRFATIRGTMSSFYMWGSFIGPITTGVIYDRTNSYAPMLWAIIALLAFASILYLLVDSPWARRQRGGSQLRSSAC